MKPKIRPQNTSRKARSKTYVYVAGDKSKTPVLARDQKPGTHLTLMAAHGRDIPFTVGTRHHNDPAAVKAAFAKYRGKPEA